MNGRIQELVKQVYGSQATEQEMKLAYLIIRECRDIVGKTRDQAIEEEWNVDEAMSTAMFDIEDYFGVK
jgi:hypothetical protein